MNKVFLVGSMKDAPESRRTRDGNKMFATATLTTSEKFRDEWKNEYHSLIIPERIAENFCRLVMKHDKVLVEGKIEYSKVGEGDNVKYYTNIAVRSFSLLTDRKRPNYNKSVEVEEF